MKTIISLLLCLLTICSFAKTKHPASNGKKVAVTPSFDRPYTVVQDPPCYEYKRHGLTVMECPGILFAPQGTGDEHAAHKTNERDEDEDEVDEAVTANIDIHHERTYLGYSRASYSMPVVPGNGRHVAVSPDFTRPYTVVQDPPCYLYKRHGRVEMECPGVLFEPGK